MRHGRVGRHLGRSSGHRRSLYRTLMTELFRHEQIRTTAPNLVQVLHGCAGGPQCGGYFFLVGALNLVVAYLFSEAFWVDYKLWSAIGYTLIIAIITALILSPHIKEDSPSETQK